MGRQHLNTRAGWSIMEGKTYHGWPVLLVIDVNDDFVGDRPGLFDAEFPAVGGAGGVAR